MRDPCRLYLITPPQIDLETFAPKLEAALDAGDVACLQLRLKEADDDDVRRAGERLLPICRAREVPLLINDRPDLAAAIGADGAHVGADDASYAEARERVGTDGMVGVSCYDSRHRAMEAAASGADYVAFGAFFPTETKTPRAKADLHLLKWWQHPDGGALRRHRRHHGRELRAAGAERRGLPRGDRRGLVARRTGRRPACKAINRAIASAGAS